ncbi:hypothetical protein [Kineosporia sp. NBRC 101731]|uniref:hypothetical protein n=1 Tax=Kineosporia sp. NBRC 101731 TaxID=3032199 RepID=UPI0024A2A3DA|nr:hypothetical protein [Kineosporia sp. NBRC 101731]GLY30319.1 hypothetical protein Kisp02_36840 [Kineosporia sp. NBRC 101731]
MTSDTNSRLPIPPHDRPTRDSLQQPVKGAPVEESWHEQEAPAAVADPGGTAQAQPASTARTAPPRGYDAPTRTAPAYADPDYVEPGYEPGYASDAPRVATTPPPAAPVTRTASVSSPGRMGFGIGVLVLGVLLGISAQQADSTGMLLRVPALLAALIMVAQGIQLILRGLPRETEVEVVEVMDDSDPSHAHTSVRPRPWAGMAALRTDPGSLGLPALVIVLAVWLGLADLRVTDASSSFSSLSMLSAFVLFALGWTMIPPRRQ